LQLRSRLQVPQPNLSVSRKGSKMSERFKSRKEQQSRSSEQISIAAAVGRWCADRHYARVLSARNFRRAGEVYTDMVNEPFSTDNFLKNKRNLCENGEG